MRVFTNIYLSAFVFDFMWSVIRRCHRFVKLLWNETKKKKRFDSQMEAIKWKNCFLWLLLRTAWNKYLWRMKIVSLRKMAASVVTRNIKIFGILSHLQRCAQCSSSFCRISEAVLSEERLIYSAAIFVRNHSWSRMTARPEVIYRLGINRNQRKDLRKTIWIANERKKNMVGLLHIQA